MAPLNPTYRTYHEERYINRLREEYTRNNTVRNTSVKNATLAKLAREAKEASEKYERAVKLHSRFTDEFVPGTILKFKHTFTNSRYATSTAYDYAALLAENGYWYLTSSNTNRMDFDELIEFIGDEECYVILPTSKAWKKV